MSGDKLEDGDYPGWTSIPSIYCLFEKAISWLFHPSDNLWPFLQTMGSVNAQMNPAQLQSTLQNFEMESSKMDMKEEMSKFWNKGYNNISFVSEQRI